LALRSVSARRTAIGYVIILLGSLLGLFVPVLHMTGKGVGGEIAKSSGAFFFIWTIIALGVTALISVILSVRGLGTIAKATSFGSEEARAAVSRGRAGPLGAD
jgi:hypothetical protein